MIQQAKEFIWEYCEAFDNTDADSLPELFSQFVTDDYNWKGVYPFREISGYDEVIEQFWRPLKESVTNLQRRIDIFIGGSNEIEDNRESKNQAVWVMNMGHFTGLFDKPWLDIPPTGKMLNIRYAEFHRIENNKITDTGLFIDLIGVMQQAGVYPLPPSTGQYFVYPGPRNHQGILRGESDPLQTQKTLDTVNMMIDDLNQLNLSGAMGCPPEVLARTWHQNMTWYGPCGIGASYTIERYQKQHQLPFRNGLGDKKYNGHVCRFADGELACFFGWPNLTNTPIGGFLGMPSSVQADMQVVDIYYRKNDKLSENWVFIDIPWWLKQQGLDVLERMRETQV
ncbi:ester cyclase [Psychrobacter sp. DAB_AL32B]|uniref:nuclear transport factor 2 family protein n=1 Tax=Psychrobacter sp. DAB_AL32B TaxID=1028414 RepID=UPI000B7CF9D2|nr:ester cyclase [Psychrobacter sp. DAB_AL32B]OXL17752.1 polyketide cyclase [Psychrobacter sp. DAB_AL32B]